MTYGFKNEHDDSETLGEYAVAPLVTFSPSGEIQFIGSGFFISANGAYVTAKHCVLDDEDKEIQPLYIVQFDTPTTYILREIKKIIYVNEYDVVMCLPTEATKEPSGEVIRNKVIPITDKMPTIGEEIVTYAYPTSKVQKADEIQKAEFNSTWHSGKSVEFHPDGFGRLKHPCLQTSVEILSGASGGPVIDSAGKIFAVNSTSFDLNDGGEPVSFVTPIAPLLDIEIEASPNEKTTLRELAKKGIIDLR